MNNIKRRNIPLALPIFDEEMETAALHAMRHERFVSGEDVFKFEEEFARYVGKEYAISTSSGTNALQIALLTLRITNGAEVITSAFSFIASSNAILHAGAFPVFADIDTKSYNIDPDEVKLKITKKTKALLPVHLYGYPCHMDELVSIAESHNLLVIEDACQAHGAEYYGQKAGAIGDAGCFSFYSSKNMTVCGDGGMIVTNDEEMAKTAAKLRDCGRKTQYEHDVLGYTSRLNTVNAAIGRVQLRRLDGWNRKRVQNAAAYQSLLSDVAEISLPPMGNSKVKPVYHLYVVRVKKRNELKMFLENHGIQCGVHYPLPITSQQVYRQLFNFADGDYPISECLSKECLSLPMYPSLCVEDIEYICERIHEFYCSP